MDQTVLNATLLENALCAPLLPASTSTPRLNSATIAGPIVQPVATKVDAQPAYLIQPIPCTPTQKVILASNAETAVRLVQPLMAALTAQHPQITSTRVILIATPAKPLALSVMRLEDALFAKTSPITSTVLTRTAMTVPLVAVSVEVLVSAQLAPSLVSSPLPQAALPADLDAQSAQLRTAASHAIHPSPTKIPQPKNATNAMPPAINVKVMEAVQTA